MATRNYNEKDISFYDQKEIQDIRVTPNHYGSLIEWDPEPSVSGYAIYRGLYTNTGWELLVTLDENVTSYQDGIPPAGVFYDYKVYAIIEGDFILGEPDDMNGVDFALTQDYDSARQDMMNRIRTQTGEWRSHPDIGADLELLEGEPNTRETGLKGEEQIKKTLTYDGRFNTQDLDVRAVPTSIETIEFYSILDTDENQPIIVKESLDL